MEKTHKIKDWLIDKSNELDIEISEKPYTLKELTSMLPDNYYFCEYVLWCGDVRIEANDYDYANMCVMMLIKLHCIDNNIEFNYNW